MSLDVKVPRLDEVQETAIVTKWYKKSGEKVSKGEAVASIETMKVSFDIESPADGLVEEIAVEEGAEVPVGAVLCRIRLSETMEQLTVPAHEALTQREPERKIRAMPAARRLAQEARVDLSKMTGTGPEGVITTGDMERYLRNLREAEYELIRLDATRREIARHLSESHASIPSAKLTIKVLADPILLLREKLEQSSGKKISLTALIVQKVAKTLLRHKKLNSVYINEEWRSYGRVHMCVALQGRKGLIAPVVRDAHIKDALKLNDDLEALQRRVEKEDLSIEDVTGGTFTLTNLGPYGILHFDAIVNAPQVAILAVGSMSLEPDWVEGKAASRSFMHLTLAFDHRIIDGYDAAMFLDELRRNLEEQPG